jgi:hypothetical protein
MCAVASDQFMEAVERFARETGAVPWSGVPTGGAFVVWRGDSIDDFLANAALLKPRVVYVARDEDVIAVAVDGVLHLFGDRAEFEDDLSEEGGVAIRLTTSWDNDDEELSADLQELAQLIADDPRYNGYRDDALLAELASHVSDDQFDALRHDAAYRFDKGAGRSLDRRAAVIVGKLLKHPEFDPYMAQYGADDDEGFVEAALVGEDSRLFERVRSELSQAVWNKGLMKQAEREVAALAANLLESMAPLDRDRLGFAFRNNVRDQVIEPYLGDVVARRRPHVAQEARRQEKEQFELQREARYATAARELIRRGHTTRSVVSMLGVGQSVVERLVASRTPDVELEASDPIVETLAPELGG